jgi:hypothetical protein
MPLLFKVSGPSDDDGSDRFGCYVSVLQLNRSKKGIKFEDEKPKPHIGNLTAHIRTKHNDQYEKGLAMQSAGRELGGVFNLESGTIPYDGGYNDASRRSFGDYIAEHGKVVRDQEGFYLSFAAFVVEDDLPWTTGEKPGIKRIFGYLHSPWALPSDTTVRKHVSRLYDSLHAYVVRELTVCAMISLLPSFLILFSDRASPPN